MKVVRNDAYKGREESSYKIFQRFTKYYDNGKCDASGIIGQECYKLWVKSRKYPPKSPHEAFRRAVTAHIRGNDGRRPFPEAAERSLLKELRKKKQWDAFRGTEHLVGVKGFTSLGHHEKIRKGLNPQINKRKLAAMKKRDQALQLKQRTKQNSRQGHSAKRLRPSQPRRKPSAPVVAQPAYSMSYPAYPFKKHPEEALITNKSQKLYKSEVELKAEDIYGTVNSFACANPFDEPLFGNGCVHNLPMCVDCFNPVSDLDLFRLDGSLDDLFGDPILN